MPGHPDYEFLDESITDNTLPEGWVYIDSLFEAMRSQVNRQIAGTSRIVRSV
jgi:hypothetical protein